MEMAPQAPMMTQPAQPGMQPMVMQQQTTTTIVVDLPTGGARRSRCLPPWATAAACLPPQGPPHDCCLPLVAAQVNRSTKSMSRSPHPISCVRSSHAAAPSFRCITSEYTAPLRTALALSPRCPNPAGHVGVRRIPECCGSTGKSEWVDGKSAPAPGRSEPPAEV